jgi:hypothetical protein
VKVYSTKHFAERLERGFDMSVIAQLINVAVRFPERERFRETNGHSTICAVRKGDTLRLTTGWVGNAKHEKVAA